MTLAYRGVSRAYDLDTEGGLRACGKENTLEFHAGDTSICAGDEWYISKCGFNALRAHSMNSREYPTSLVSFTTSRAVAVKFATSNGSTNGWIYTIDLDKVAANSIRVVSAETTCFHPEEKEIYLDLIDHTSLPTSLIVSKIEVSSEEYWGLYEQGSYR